MISLAALLVYSTPVALAALGETVNQKAGSLNIGIEGVMLSGAYFGMVAALATGSPGLGLVVGAVFGLAFSILQALFTVALSVDQVVVGTALNLLALGATGTLFRARFGESGALLSVPTLSKFGGVDAVVILTLALVPAVALLLFRTRWGLAVRAAGEYPEAVEASGYSVDRLRLAALLVGGAMAGLAGAYLAVGIAGSFATNMTAGRGFIAIAMVTFGRWNPFWTFGACLLVGALDSLQYVFQAKGIGIAFQALIALPYIVALLVLLGVGRGSAAPAALGRPFRRSA
ncbi:MAG TPA: ABC transporter permease [Fimbriimonadaceae bacterium]|nr:ABC transporter permease [Fimbriimonadaceae bacterium]HRJ96062.1 ABC transporter permease [Fimbriimonadaceae bacterium]